MISVSPSVFAFDDYRVFLKTWYEERKEAGKPVSFRNFSRQAGFSSPNFLKLVIDGRRNLTARSIPKFVKALRLQRQEAEFFEALVLFNQAKSAEEKNRYYDRMVRCRRYREIRELEHDQFEYYSHWYYPAVRELIGVGGFRDDPDWIARTLHPAITSRQAREALRLLEKLRLVERTSEGGLRQIDRTVSSGAEVRSLAVKNFHLEMLKKAARALDDVRSAERDVSGVMIAVPASRIPDIKDRINRFRKELLASIDSSSESADRLYHLAIQWFPVSKGKERS